MAGAQSIAAGVDMAMIEPVCKNGKDEIWKVPKP
jgi:hypothetical protein